MSEATIDIPEAPTTGPLNSPSGAPSRPVRHTRATPLAARGEPLVWLTGMAMAICLGMIVSLLALVLVEGSITFWPRPIDRVTLQSGAVLLGSPIRDESYEPTGDEAKDFAAVMAGLSPEARGRVTTEDGKAVRRLYRVGNKEFRGQPFEWVSLYRIAELRRDDDAVMLERAQWGVWFGYPEAVLELPEGISGKEAAAKIEKGTVDSQETLARMLAAQRAGEERSAELLGLQERAVGRINRGLEDTRLRLKQAEIDLARARRTGSDGMGQGRGVGVGLWGLMLTVGLGSAAGFIALRRSGPSLGRSLGRSLAIVGLGCVACGMGLAAALENPWSGSAMTPEKLAQIRVQHDAEVAALRAEYAEVLGRIHGLDAEDARHRVIVREPTDGKFAPVRQTEPDEPLRASQIVRIVQANTLGTWGKIGVYLDRWREFLLDNPREANTEGGVFPVIIGTVVLTLLLSVAVVPLGVIAALYMREYAKQGPVMSMIRIAVNNLAGVPSIVYGVFGMGFFCYTVGQYVDKGPDVPWTRGQWWGGIGALLLGVFGAFAAGRLAQTKPGTHPTRAQKRWATAAGLGWIACVIGACALIAGVPMFHGFYEAAAESSSTFGSKGMIWAAMTLALLTLPVVIVATEEALAAVPRSLREASYGCGASKWQTIRRIVLPRAMPGVMTGMILAMARGAGEVAPLMLVGAVKKVSELPVSWEFPYLHLSRSFMHLGFHIYDVGFQSADAEAARPLVWTTTLVLVAIVLLLNLTAIRVRSRLRRRFLGGAF